MTQQCAALEVKKLRVIRTSSPDILRGSKKSRYSNVNPVLVQPIEGGPRWKGIRVAVSGARIRTIITIAVMWAVLFDSAGDLLWWQGWGYMAVLFASTVLPLYGPFRFDEGLIEERISRKPDAKRWDRIFVGLVAILTIIVCPRARSSLGLDEAAPDLGSLAGARFGDFGTVSDGGEVLRSFVGRPEVRIIISSPLTLRNTHPRGH